MALEQNVTDSRLSAPDWQDKYRWPDPEEGWSGPLAGYPPDHPVRRGTKIALKLIARKYWADPKVTRYRQWITGWPEESVVTEKPEVVTKKAVSVTEKQPVTENPGGVTKKRGRPAKDGKLSAAEKQAAYRARGKDKPDLMSDAFAAALDKFADRAAAEAPDDDLPHEERVRRDRERKAATRELWAKTKGES